jgi:hypothetical protein
LSCVHFVSQLLAELFLFVQRIEIYTFAYVSVTDGVDVLFGAGWLELRVGVEDGSRRGEH